MNKDYHTFINFLLVAVLSLSAVGLSGCNQNLNPFQRTIEVPGDEMERWKLAVYFKETATTKDRAIVRDFVDNFVDGKSPKMTFDGSKKSAIIVHFEINEREMVVVPDEVYNVVDIFRFSNKRMMIGWHKPRGRNSIYTMRY